MIFLFYFPKIIFYWSKYEKRYNYYFRQWWLWKECINFLNKLIDDVNKFYIEKEEFNKYIFTSQNYKIVYFNENKKINSPIAILDGQWGCGKTHFIDRLCQYIDNSQKKLNNINSVNITHVIYLNAIDFILEDNISKSIILEILTTLKIWNLWTHYYKSNNFKKIWKILIKFYASNNFRKITKYILKNIFVNFINNQFSLNLSQLENSNADNIVKMNKLIKFIDSKKILLIVDNIERLHSKSWEVIYSLSIFSQLNNFIILLPMNLNNLELNSQYLDTDVNIEDAIKKYVNLPIYNISVSYKTILKNYFSNLNDEIISTLDVLLTKIPINLSFRDFKKILVNIDKNIIKKLNKCSIIQNLNIFIYLFELNKLDKTISLIIDIYRNDLKNIRDNILNYINKIQLIFDLILDTYNASNFEKEEIYIELTIIDNYLEALNNNQCFIKFNIFNIMEGIELFIKKIINLMPNNQKCIKFYKLVINEYGNEINEILNNVYDFKNKIKTLFNKNLDYTYIISKMTKHNIVFDSDDISYLINDIKQDIYK